MMQQLYNEKKTVGSLLCAVITRILSGSHSHCSSVTGCCEALNPFLLHRKKKKKNSAPGVFQATTLLCLPLFGKRQSLWPQSDQLWGKCGESVCCASDTRKGLFARRACSRCIFSPRRCKCLRKGKSSLMRCYFWFHFTPALVNTPLGGAGATPLVNLLNSATFLKVCSPESSRTCYKGPTESMAQPTHFFQWFLALADC